MLRSIKSSESTHYIFVGSSLLPEWVLTKLQSKQKSSNPNSFSSIRFYNTLINTHTPHIQQEKQQRTFQNNLHGPSQPRYSSNSHRIHNKENADVYTIGDFHSLLNNLFIKQSFGHWYSLPWRQSQILLRSLAQPTEHSMPKIYFLNKQ